MTTDSPVYLWKFGELPIPAARGAFGWPVAARERAVRTLGGVFDAAGAGAGGLALPYPLSYAGLVVDNSDTTVIRQQLDALRARADSYDRLWLKLADGPERWAWARLLTVTPQVTAEDRGSVSFGLGFRVDSGWHGDAHGGDADVAVTLTGSPQFITLYSGGNVPVDDAVIYVTASDAPITYLKWSTSVTWGLVTFVSEMEFTGTIAAHDTLTIGCGDCTVLNSNNDAYNDLHRLAAHNCPTWLRIMPVYLSDFDHPELNWFMTVTVTYEGGGTGSSIRFAFWDGWA